MYKNKSCIKVILS